MTGRCVRLSAFLGLLFVLFSAAFAAGPFAGWERLGDYDRHYRVEDVEKIKGTVRRVVEVTPLPGMAPGKAVVVETRAGKDVEVQLGPSAWTASIADAFSPGDSLAARGVFAEIGGRRVFMAAKVWLEGVKEFKLRMTKNGYPAWD